MPKLYYDNVGAVPMKVDGNELRCKLPPKSNSKKYDVMSRKMNGSYVVQKTLGFCPILGLAPTNNEEVTDRKFKGKF